MKQYTRLGYDKSSSFSESQLVRTHRRHWRRSGCCCCCLLLIVLQLLVGGITWSFSQGLQRHSPIESSLFVKQVGLTYHNGSFLDNADFVVPDKRIGVITFFTNLLVTPLQTRAVCNEKMEVVGANCTSDSDCETGKTLIGGHGVLTGACNITASPRVCTIQAWCPLEDERDQSKRIFSHSEKFYVLLRNDVKFPELNEEAVNVPRNMSLEQYRLCLNNPDHELNNHCPRFSLKSMVERTGSQFDEDLKLHGAQIEMTIDWNCSFDTSTECLPTYRFTRLDAPTHKGFRARYSDVYRLAGGAPGFRNQYTASGVQIIVNVMGKGGLPSTRIIFWSGTACILLAAVLIIYVIIQCAQSSAVLSQKSDFIISSE